MPTSSGTYRWRHSRTRRGRSRTVRSVTRRRRDATNAGRHRFRLAQVLRRLGSVMPFGVRHRDPDHPAVGGISENGGDATEPTASTYARKASPVSRWRLGRVRSCSDSPSLWRIAFKVVAVVTFSSTSAAHRCQPFVATRPTVCLRAGSSCCWSVDTLPHYEEKSVACRRRWLYQWHLLFRPTAAVIVGTICPLYTHV